jgi:hypothetical protein
MALKGRSKSRSRRGSSRRPAGAPRTIAPPRRKLPWWGTRTARIWFGVAAVAILLLVLWLVKNSRDDAAALERKQDVLEEFTSEISTLQQSVASPASEMVVATVDTPDLKAETNRWIKTFNAARDDFTQANITAPSGLDVAHQMFFQGVLQYMAAVETYKLAADLEGDLQSRAIERANAQVAASDGIWQSAITLLDQERQEAELGASGLTVPSVGGVSPQATPSPQVMEEPIGGASGRKKNRNNGNRRGGG